MIELNVIQGSEEWHAARAKCFNASEAPAMMGASQYMSRAALLRQKATGIVPEVDAATQRRFDEGHAAEAAARPIVEEIIGEELYPIVATDDAGQLLASSDGATMLCDIGLEHKRWNKSLAAKVAAGEVPESNKWQLDQQIAVFGFNKIIFVVSDGTRENFVYCWYVSSPERIAKLKAGWAQFAEDLKNYQPEAAKPEVVAAKSDSLPALVVQVEGRVVSTNMDAFKAAAERFISRLPVASKLATDQDFADADQAVKDCQEAEDKLKLVKSQAQAQAVSIDEIFRAIDGISEKIRAARLSLDKAVKAEKENRKAELVRETAMSLNKHYADLSARIGMPMPAFSSTFGDVIKGLKTLDSMRDKLSVALANAKVEASAIADRIEANRKTVEDMTLFPDFANVCTKAPEDFAAMVAMRVGQRKEAEAKRLEAERERIRQEEQARIAREQAAAQRAAEQQAAAERAAQAQAIEAAKTEPAPEVKPEPVAATVSEPRHVSDVIADTGATMKLGEINAAIGVVSVTADQLAALGFKPVKEERAAKLYSASAFPAICAAIVRHVQAVAAVPVKLAA